MLERDAIGMARSIYLHARIRLNDGARTPKWVKLCSCAGFRPWKDAHTFQGYPAQLHNFKLAQNVRASAFVNFAYFRPNLARPLLGETSGDPPKRLAFPKVKASGYLLPRDLAISISGFRADHFLG